MKIKQSNHLVPNGIVTSPFCHSQFAFTFAWKMKYGNGKYYKYSIMTYYQIYQVHLLTFLLEHRCISYIIAILMILQGTYISHKWEPDGTHISHNIKKWAQVVITQGHHNTKQNVVNKISKVTNIINPIFRIQNFILYHKHHHILINNNNFP